jgi:hypothetical protein
VGHTSAKMLRPDASEAAHRMNDDSRVGSYASPADDEEGLGRVDKADFCDPPSESIGLEAFFTGSYERTELEGVGHFPPSRSTGAGCRRRTS